MQNLLENLMEGNFETSNLVIGEKGLQTDSTNLLNEAGLNWEVNKIKLFTPENEFSGFYATQRADNKHCFGSFKEQYEIFQNKELAELVMALSNHFNFDLKGGGSFKGGAKVFLQLKDQSITDFGINHDTLENYITATNSHDGSTSLAFGLTNLTISCQNSFYRAYKSLNNKVRHTSSMRNRVEMAINDIKGIQEEEKTLFEKFFTFSNTNATAENINSVVKKLFKADLTKTSSELSKELSTRAINQVNDAMLSISSEMKEKGFNLWGLFSGITHYTTHKMSAPKRENGRLETKYFGGAQEMDKRAFELISAI